MGTEVWLEEQQELQSALQPHEDPAWLTSDLTKKIMTLQKTLGRLQHRRIRTPTPSPSASSKEAAADEEAKADPFSGVDFDNLNFDPEENAQEIPVVDVEDEEPIPLGGEEAIPEGENS